MDIALILHWLLRAGFGGGRFDDEPAGGSRWRAGGGAPTSPMASGSAPPGERQSLTVSAQSDVIGKRHPKPSCRTADAGVHN